MLAIEEPLPFDDGFPAPGGPFLDPSAGAFAGLSGLFGLLFVLALAWGAFVAYRRWRVLHDAGLDPLTVDEQLAARLVNGPLGTPAAAPAPTLEQRLVELDDLRSRGVITADEHAAARAQVLSGR